MKLLRASTGDCVASDLRPAQGMRARLIGLIGKTEIPGSGLLIEPADSIHTFFMSMPIDVIFLAADGRVLKLCRMVYPWRICLSPRAARTVLEMRPGFIDSNDLAVGEILKVKRP
jgi:uncharacterized membrane protein (UPF0127 family)